MADVLKAVTVHFYGHRCKGKLHWCFSCRVILIPGRTTVGWHSSTSPGITYQGTSKGIWLLEQHRDLHTQHTPMEVFVLSLQHVKTFLECTKQQVFAGKAFLVTLTEVCTETNSMPLKSQGSARQPPCI